MMLVAPGKPRQRQVEEPAPVLEDEPAMFFRARKSWPATLNGAPTVRPAFPARQGGILLRAEQGRHAALENARLGGGDPLDGRAEEFGMIHRHRRHQSGGRRRDHVGRVEGAAEPDLEEQIIGRMFGEELECRRRGDLEEGDRPAVVGALADGQRRGELGLVDQLAGEPDPLVKRTRCGEV